MCYLVIKILVFDAKMIRVTQRLSTLGYSTQLSKMHRIYLRFASALEWSGSAQRRNTVSFNDL